MGSFKSSNPTTREVGSNGGVVVWDDLRAPASGLNPSGTISPPAVNTADGSLTFDTTEAVAAWFQLPHGYKIGSDLHIHIHWSKTTSAAGTVNWQVKYKTGNIGEVMGAFSSLESLTESVGNGNTANLQALSSHSTVDGSALTLSSMICVYLIRTASGDTYGADVNLYEIDIHYQADTIGSLSLLTKE